MIDYGISALVEYGINAGLLEKNDEIWATNMLLNLFNCDSYTQKKVEMSQPLEEILKILLDYAVKMEIIEDNITSRDLFDTKIMGIITPRPSQVNKKFHKLYKENPKLATDWYYDFSQKTDYIRTYRIEKDKHWITDTKYGKIDITINLSKPEKDVKSIAAAKLIASSGYPLCVLCKENEGYAGRINHQARQNHRIIPIEIANKSWFLQYSPYVYYREHCIIFSGEHTPMSVNRSTFQKLLDFVEKFPHYFVGSNADLPIVGGSILSHDHFQGGRYTFAMEKAPIEKVAIFKDYPQVEAGIVNWPMSVIRLTCENKEDLISLSDKILNSWREYTDEKAFIFAKTNDTSHNTITPIARKTNGKFQIDLVLRNNITTDEYPEGVYHPHQEMHHIKKENIGLIEVMGLAVLPPRLKTEMEKLAEVLLSGEDVKKYEDIEKHSKWAEKLKLNYVFTKDNVDYILQEEMGKAFAIVLEQAGVYPLTATGRENFLKFIQQV